MDPLSSSFFAETKQKMFVFEIGAIGDFGELVEFESAPSFMNAIKIHLAEFRLFHVLLEIGFVSRVLSFLTSLVVVEEKEEIR